MPEATPAPPPLAPRERLGLVVLLLALVAAYANTLNAPFVYDDILAIPDNPSLRKLWPLTDVLVPKVDGGVTVSGRPILNLSFAFNHAISGANPWSYHVTNLLIHAGSTLLLFGLLRRTLPQVGTGGPLVRENSRSALSRATASTSAAFLALLIAALWSLHPLQTQAITYTVQRAESLMGFFYLLTFYGFARTATAPNRPHLWKTLTISACALGMATKEVMVTAPALLLLYDRTFLAGSFAAALRARWRLHLALAATWLVLAAAMASTGGNRGGTIGLGVGLPLWAYPLTQFKALATYLGLSVWPHPLIFEYGTFWAKQAADVVPFAIVILPLLAATILALARWPALGFLGAWFFAILAPTSLAPGTIQMIVEHRMYLPLAAVIAALVLLGRKLAGPRALPLGGIIAGAFAITAAVRNHDYRTNLALWHDTVAKRPLNPRAHDGLAEALAAAGRFEAAIKVREESVRLLPDESQHHYNLALTLAAAGRTEDAIRHYQLSLRLFPNEPRTHNNLAILLAKLGRHADALTHYAEAVRLRPAEPLYRYNYGIALSRLQQWSAAASEFTHALTLRPDYADAHYNLGAAFLRSGRAAEAHAHFAAAARLKPTDIDYLVGHGNALLVSGRAAEALAEFQRAHRTHPDSPEAQLGVANALAGLRRHTEAISEYEALLQRRPAHAAAHFKLGNALLDVDRAPDAIRHYESAIRLLPADAEAHHNLGIAFAKLERWEEAQRAFDEALRLKPDYADARRSREQLRQVTGR